MTEFGGRPPRQPRKPDVRNAWQQPVMTLGVLLLVAAVLLPVAGGVKRWRLGEAANAAADDFRKAVVAASDSHGPLLAALGGDDVQRATETLTDLAEREPVRAMDQYRELHMAYREWMAEQGRGDLQPTLDAAAAAYDRVVEADRNARAVKARHDAVLGEFVRYAGYAGGGGLALIIWTALTGLWRPRRSEP